MERTFVNVVFQIKLGNIADCTLLTVSCLLTFSDCKPGHIPGAINAPFPGIFAPYTSPDGEEFPKGAIKSVDELKKMFSSCGVDIDKPMTLSCGTGNDTKLVYPFDKKKTALFEYSWS